MDKMLYGNSNDSHNDNNNNNNMNGQEDENDSVVLNGVEVKLYYLYS